MILRYWLSALFGVVLTLGIAGCSSDDGGTVSPPRDVDPPGTVSDLAVTAGAAGAITLAWTAPGDDRDAGTAWTYDLRYTTYTGSVAGWEGWTSVPTPPTPLAYGTAQEFTVSGLTADQVYVFKLKAADEESNWSGESNAVVATAAPQHDTTPPATVTDLSHVHSTRTRLTLTWTAPGDDGDLGRAIAYDLRYATESITPANWDAATPVPTSAPLAAGSTEEVTVTGLTRDTAYFFALQVRDEAVNWSALSNVRPAATNLEWYVAVDGSGDAPTIRAACVDSATVGDVIVVGPGRYTWANQGDGNPNYGMIYFPRDTTGFVLRSETGPEETIIDAQGQNRVFFIQGITAGNPHNVTIDGFTITGGNTFNSVYEDSSGAGIISHHCSPTIRNCIIEENEAVFVGGGFWHGGVGSPLIEDCVFRNNRAEMGGAIFILNSRLAVTVRGCEIYDNIATVAGGGMFAFNIAFHLEDSVLYENSAGQRGGGLSVWEVHPSTVSGCTIVENSALEGGNVRVRGAATDLTITSCIVANARGGGAFSTLEDPDLGIRCCNVFGNAGGDNLPAGSTLGGNFSLDPRFCGGLGTNDYRLRTDSPCLSGQHPNEMDCGLIGAKPEGCSAP